MPMIRFLILVPKAIKARLDALRRQGISSSKFIRSLLEREFQKQDDENTHNPTKE